MNRPAGLDATRTGKRRRRQEGPAYRERELALIYDTAPVGLAFLGPDLRYVRINATLAAMNGRSIEDHIGRSIRDVIPEQAPALEAYFQEILENGRPIHDVEISGTTPAAPGSRRTWLNHFSAVKDERGAIVGINVVVSDITEQKAAAAALYESEQRFRQIAENLEVVLNVSEPELDKVHYVNPAYERIWGRSRQSLYDDPASWMEVIHPEDRGKVRAAVENIPREGKVDIKYRIIRPDGTVRRMHGNAYPVRDRAGRCIRIIGITSDETERLRAEEVLAAYRDKLRQLARELAAAGERERRRIAAGLHDTVVQNLAVLRIRIGALLRQFEGDVLGEDITRLQALLDDALRDCRSLVFELSPPVLHELGLEAALEWLCEHVGSEFELDCSLTVRGSPSPELGEDASSALFQAARELLLNICKHASASRASIELRGGDTVELIVADDGAGFDAAAAMQYEPACGGFGLFSIRERLRDMNGDVEIESSPGAGTRVALRLPGGPEMRRP